MNNQNLSNLVAIRQADCQSSVTANKFKHPKGIAMTLTGMALASLILLAGQTTTVFAKAEPAHSAANLADINVNDGFAELVKAVKPAVVNISVTGHSKALRGNRQPDFQGSPQLEEFFKHFFGQIPGRKYAQPKQSQPESQQPYQRRTTAVGSGFVVDPDGLVVTNYHVIENANEIEVVFDNGTRVPATLKGTDKKTDLALLKINADKPLPYVVFGNSDNAEVGDWVVAIGNPFGLGGTTTSGIISARGRDIHSGPLDDFIQIDASINRGNSGGPLFNTKGEVIGVNSAIYSPNGGSVGIGFAIPASMANNVIDQLKESGSVQRGYLGVHIQSLDEDIADSLGLDDTAGALVTEVMRDSPALAAGLESGDVILKYDGKKVSKMRDLPKFVALTKNGNEVEVEVWRNNARKAIKVAVGTNDQPSLAENAAQPKSSPGLGLALAKVDSDQVAKFGLEEDTVGVVIVDVAPQSSAAEKGLRAGDIIKRVGNKNVTEPNDVTTAIKSFRDANKDSVLLLVERDKQSRFVVVPMNA